jgi:predicted DNA-binding transcriptional regulator AlpA
LELPHEFNDSNPLVFRGRPVEERMTLRVDDLAVALGMSRRTIERLRSAGRFPAPDLRVGRIPLWRPETIRTWLDNR